MNRIQTGDTVVIITGRDRGNTGKVLEYSPSEKKVIIEGQNLVTKHIKPSRQGEAGGIVTVEGPIYADKVALYCANCDAGRRSKIKVEADGTKVRVCAKCGQTI